MNTRDEATAEKIASLERDLYAMGTRLSAAEGQLASVQKTLAAMLRPAPEPRTSRTLDRAHVRA